MTVDQLATELSLNAASLPDPDREVSGAYIGDLLSWVMGRAPADCAWITIMSNINVCAVASLADVACVILAEGVEPDPPCADAAAKRGINLLTSSETAYTIASKLAKLGI